MDWVGFYGPNGNGLAGRDAMRIDHYSFGSITIDGHGYCADVIVYPDHIDDAWWRAEGHVCGVADLSGVWICNPATLVIGTGDPGLMRVNDGLKDYCAGNGIKLIVLPTNDAVERYNERMAAGESVVAAFHLTC